MSRFVARTALTAGFLLAGGAAHASIYEFTTVNTLMAGAPNVYAVNDLGQVLMSESTGLGKWASDVSSGTVVTNLNTLSGSQFFLGADINNAGQVAGNNFVIGAGNTGNAAILTNGSITNLSILNTSASGQHQSVAFGLNNAGQVVGWSTAASGPYFHATLWSGNTAIDLGAKLEGSSTAYAINNAGQVAGAAEVRINGILNTKHAVVWSGGSMTDLGAASGGRDSSASDINDGGVVVGTSNIFSGDAYLGQHATVWNGSAITDLGTLGYADSVPTGINDQGLIVGNLRTWDVVTQKQSAFLATADGSMVDLNDLLNAQAKSDGWRLVTADDINNEGWIVGTAKNILSGAGVAYMLKPMAAVPEPETCALMLTGLGLIGWLARRRKAA